jgi:hypothetical protein
MSEFSENMKIIPVYNLYETMCKTSMAALIFNYFYYDIYIYAILDSHKKISSTYYSYFGPPHKKL